MEKPMIFLKCGITCPWELLMRSMQSQHWLLLIYRPHLHLTMNFIKDLALALWPMCAIIMKNNFQ